MLLKNYALVLRKLGRKREAKRFETQGQLIQRATVRRNGIGSMIDVTTLRFERAVSDPK